jgi:hypothetical protein
VSARLFGPIGEREHERYPHGDSVLDLSGIGTEPEFNPAAAFEKCVDPGSLARLHGVDGLIEGADAARVV